jgi:hypothetical protein
VVAAIVLVNVGTRGPVVDLATSPLSGTTTSTTAAAGAGSTTTTAAGAGSTTTSTTTKSGPTTTIPKSSTTVLVANNSNGAGLAAHYSTLLSGQGWDLKPPVDGTSKVASSAVYYASGQKPAALAIASALSLNPSAVHPLTTSVPVTAASGNDVVVVIGADLVDAG